MTVPPDYVNKVKHSDESMDMDTKVPTTRQPANAQGHQHAKKKRHLDEAEDTVNLQAHGLCRGVGIFVAWRSPLAERPLKNARNNLGAISMRHARQENTPHVHKCQDAECYPIVPVGLDVGLGDVATIENMTANPGRC
jgi:hypothetical protein